MLMQIERQNILLKKSKHMHGLDRNVNEEHMANAEKIDVSPFRVV